MTAARTGRPPLTSRDQLLAAAHEIGFADLTVGKVTEAVGVKYSTFYRHFDTLADLTATLVDHVLADGTWPQPGPWRAHVSGLASALSEAVERWPGLADAIRTAPDWFPTRLGDVMRRAVAQLDAAGFQQDSDVVVDAVVSLVLDGRGDAVGLVLEGLEARLVGRAGDPR